MNVIPRGKALKTIWLSEFILKSFISRIRDRRRRRQIRALQPLGYGRGRHPGVGQEAQAADPAAETASKEVRPYMRAGGGGEEGNSPKVVVPGPFPPPRGQ